MRNFVDEEWGKYCDKIAKSGTWGDHITLIAMVELLNVGIRIISSVVGDEFMTEIDPSTKSGDKSLGRMKVLFLGHRSEFHYVSLVEDGDMMMSISTHPEYNPSKMDVDPKMVELAHSMVFLKNEPPKLQPKRRRVIKINNVRVGETRLVFFLFSFFSFSFFLLSPPFSLLLFSFLPLPTKKYKGASTSLNGPKLWLNCTTR